MQTEPSTVRGAAGTVLTLLLALAASVGIAGVAGYFALELMPCSWFGSSFEGACGYGAVMATLAGGLVLSAVLFLTFVVVYFKRRQRGAPAPALSAQELADAPRLLGWWRAVFVLMLAAHALPLLLGAMWYGYSSQLSTALWWLGMLLLLAHGLMVYLVAKLYNQQPVVLALVSVLIGVFGAIGVFIFLHTAAGRKPASAA